MQWDSSHLSVTPAVSFLSRCVAREVLSQEEIDSASSQLSPAFSSQLHTAEQQIKTQRQLEQLQLQTELLQAERRSADVSHGFFLAPRFQVLQTFCAHLQHLLKEQSGLRRRLARPLGRTNLPVRAHLHRSLVELVQLLLDFMETLEEKMDAVRRGPALGEELAQLDAAVTQLLARVVEVEGLSNQVLQRSRVDTAQWDDL
ncbi:HAUS augmin-like complex subunit 2 [Gasterosteus aculeatus]